MKEGDLSRAAENPKTAYFAAELLRLLTEEREVRELAGGGLGSLAEEELARLEEQKKALESEIEKILDREEQEEEFPNEAVLEVRAGVGGGEAALFAGELAGMYRAYAESKNWNVRGLS